MSVQLTIEQTFWISNWLHLSPAIFDKFLHTIYVFKIDGMKEFIEMLLKASISDKEERVLKKVGAHVSKHEREQNQSKCKWLRIVNTNDVQSPKTHSGGHTIWPMHGQENLTRLHFRHSSLLHKRLPISLYTWGHPKHVMSSGTSLSFKLHVWSIAIQYIHIDECSWNFISSVVTDANVTWSNCDIDFK